MKKCGRVQGDLEVQYTGASSEQLGMKCSMWLGPRLEPEYVWRMNTLLIYLNTGTTFYF